MAYADALGVTNKQNGYLEGNGWLISWCIGHLAELASPEQYDEKYAKWQREDLPIVPKNWRYIITKPKQAQFKILRELMNREDVSEVVNACDAGREGELIFRNVYILANCKKPMKRLWLSSMEASAILDGFQNLRDGSEYDGLYQAALCRAKADWLIGINGTRLYSVLYHRTLNVGRVMSSTLAMLVEREAAIRAFDPTPFYTPVLSCGGMEISGPRCDSRDEAERIAAACGGAATVTNVERAEKAVKPPALFDLTTLQREANRRCGFTAQQTLDYLQSLYEKKLVTYPRTDSRYLTDDMASVVEDRVLIAANLCQVEIPEPDAIHAAQVLDSGKVSDHHAIIPTEAAADVSLSLLPDGEAIILGLVCWSVLRAVADDYRYSEAAATLDCGGTMFTVKGKAVIDSGWMRYEKQERTHTLPELAEWQVLEVNGISIKEGQTSAPKPYTEDTLLAGMENAGGKDMPEDAERRGIGTPATRAAILEKLIATGLVVRKKVRKQVRLVPSQAGISLITVLPEQLQSPALTAEWEHKLKMVENGELSPAIFLYEIEEMLRELVYEAKPIPGAEVLFPSGRPVIGKCPRCGGDVTESKNGFFCESNDCRFALWRDNRYLTAKRVELTRDMAKSLLDEGQVMVRGLYSEKTDTTYDAMLVLDDDGKRMHYRLSFDYAE